MLVSRESMQASFTMSTLSLAQNGLKYIRFDGIFAFTRGVAWLCSANIKKVKARRLSCGKKLSRGFWQIMLCDEALGAIFVRKVTRFIKIHTY